MEPREVIERAHEAEAARNGDNFAEKFGVVAVAMLAALLAVAAVFGRREVKNLLLYQQQAADAANIAESNDIKLRINDAALINLRVFATDPDTGAAAEAEIARLESDNKEIFRPEQARLQARAEELDEKRDEAERSYESFETAEAVLQIAIVIVTISTAVHSTRGVLGGGVLAAIGLVLVLDGFFTFLPY